METKNLYLIEKKVGDKYSYAFSTDDIEKTGLVDGVELDWFMERDEAEKLLAELQAYCDERGYVNVELSLEAFDTEQLYREMFEGEVARHHTGEAFCIEGEAGDELIAFLVEHRPRMLNTNDMDDARLIDPESLDIATEDDKAFAKLVQEQAEGWNKLVQLIDEGGQDNSLSMFYAGMAEEIADAVMPTIYDIIQRYQNSDKGEQLL